MLEAVTLMVFGRILERVLIASGGLLCLWLGYKLFFVSADSVKSLILEGRVLKLRAELIAPGIFFAAFGSALLGYAAYTKIDVSIPKDFQGGKTFTNTAPSNTPPLPPTTPASPISQFRIVGAMDSSTPSVPPAIRAANTLLRLRQVQDDTKSTNLSGSDHATFMKATKLLTAIQRDYIDQRYRRPGLYDEILEIQSDCERGLQTCKEYLADSSRKQLRDQVLHDLAAKL